jgi:hypothetical protein
MNRIRAYHKSSQHFVMCSSERCIWETGRTAVRPYLMPFNHPTNCCRRKANG